MWNYPTHFYAIIHAKPKLRLANDFRDRRPLRKANCQQKIIGIPLYQDNSLMANCPLGPLDSFRFNILFDCSLSNGFRAKAV